MEANVSRERRISLAHLPLNNLKLIFQPIGGRNLVSRHVRRSWKIKRAFYKHFIYQRLHIDSRDWTKSRDLYLRDHRYKCLYLRLFADTQRQDPRNNRRRNVKTESKARFTNRVFKLAINFIPIISDRRTCEISTPRCNANVNIKRT